MIGRYAVLALALLVGAEAKQPDQAMTNHMTRLMRGAKPTKNNQLIRKLEEEYIPDITGYSLRFEQCQFVKMYDDEMADNEEAGTILGVQHFVIFKLCPTGGDCSYDYGEYAIIMEDYLESMVQYAQEAQENMCNTCNENCNNGGRKLEDAEEDADADNQQWNNYNYDCDCMDTCYKIENMEENGYVDATEFLECQAVYEDNYGNQLFAGPYCSGGEKIKIGIFTDEECMYLDTSKDVEEYLQDDDGYSMKLSHALLKTTYDKDSEVSCLAVDENADNNDNNNNNNQEEPEVNEVCEQLYELAAKCEQSHGFDNGYKQFSEYENQYVQESKVCDYISSLKSGTYSEEGDIIVGSGGVTTRAGGTKPTGGQKFALTFFILGTVGLAVYSAMLHSQLTKGAKADLSKQGGAMA
mmetsp:Transcript_15108/g.32907  ORF Transcript_15108/g.32907 Transcript_15108/m.32907 type:complete len:411 (+) Transcript_15108:75-1307(+)